MGDYYGGGEAFVPMDQGMEVGDGTEGGKGGVRSVDDHLVDWQNSPLSMTPEEVDEQLRVWAERDALETAEERAKRQAEEVEVSRTLEFDIYGLPLFPTGF